jgi:hypothetical protein
VVSRALLEGGFNDRLLEQGNDVCWQLRQQFSSVLQVVQFSGGAAWQRRRERLRRLTDMCVEFSKRCFYTKHDREHISGACWAMVSAAVICQIQIRAQR